MQLHQNQTIKSNLWRQIQKIWFFEIWWQNGAASSRAHWSYPYVELWTFHLKLFFVWGKVHAFFNDHNMAAYILSKMDASTASSEMRKNCSITQSSKCIHLSNKNEGVSGGCPRVLLSNQKSTNALPIFFPKPSLMHFCTSMFSHATHCYIPIIHPSLTCTTHLFPPSSQKQSFSKKK